MQELPLRPRLSSAKGYSDVKFPPLATDRPVLLFLLIASMLVLLSGCLQQQQEAASAPPPPVPVTTAKVETRDTPIKIEFVGKTASSRRVEIRSRVEGFLESRVYTEGTLVEKGQVMFQMDRKPFEAQLDAARAELAQQQAKLTNAEANLTRVKPLAKKNAVAKKELDDALGIYRSAAAAVEAAQAKVVQAELDLGYTTIMSPVTGVSSFATQREGAYIGIGNNSLLTYVAKIDPIWVEFSVSENQLLQARANEKAGLIREPKAGEFKVEIVLADGSVYPHTGRITFSDASLSETTGTFLLRAELPNPVGETPQDQLRPGQFVRVHLKGAIRPDAIVVPQRAVQQGAKGSFVWVIGDDRTVRFQPVTVGAWRDDQWFIDEGLEGGETIVVDGALKLRAGATVQITEPEQQAGASQPVTKG
jgi:membrane fusion protein (multidrug efflux system)